MATREHEREIDSSELDQEEREFNQAKYEELHGLMEGKAWVIIETDTHRIRVQPEDVCVREGGCLDIKISPLSHGRDVITFDYHINHFAGVVEIGLVEDYIYAHDFGIPGGGAVWIEGVNEIEKEEYSSDPDYATLARFIMDQAAIGRKTFPKPTAPQT